MPKVNKKSFKASNASLPKKQQRTNFRAEVKKVNGGVSRANRATRTILGTVGGALPLGLGAVASGIVGKLKAPLPPGLDKDTTSTNNNSPAIADIQNVQKNDLVADTTPMPAKPAVSIAETANKQAVNNSVGGGNLDVDGQPQQQSGQSFLPIPPQTPPAENKNKTLYIVGAIALIGLIVFLIVRKK